MAALFEIVFIAAAVNHLGLIAAIERVVKRRLLVLNCSKCLAFWLALAYFLLGRHSVIDSAAAAFAGAYLAVWAELLMYFVDSLYLMIYGKISNGKASDNEAATTTAATAGGNPGNTVSQLRKKQK